MHHYRAKEFLEETKQFIEDYESFKNEEEIDISFNSTNYDQRMLFDYKEIEIEITRYDNECYIYNTVSFKIRRDSALGHHKNDAEIINKIINAAKEIIESNG